MQEKPRECETAFLAGRKLAHQPVAEHGDPESIQNLFIRYCAVKDAPIMDHFIYGQLGFHTIQMTDVMQTRVMTFEIPDRRMLPENAALGGFQKPGQNPQKAGFSTAVLTCDEQKTAGFQFEADIAEYGAAATPAGKRFRR